MRLFCQQSAKITETLPFLSAIQHPMIWKIVIVLYLSLGFHSSFYKLHIEICIFVKKNMSGPRTIYADLSFEEVMRIVSKKLLDSTPGNCVRVIGESVLFGGSTKWVMDFGHAIAWKWIYFNLRKFLKFGHDFFVKHSFIFLRKVVVSVLEFHVCGNYLSKFMIFFHAHL